MKFLCISCDEVMAFAERQIPGDGTMAAVFQCPGCDREMAMLTNPMETQLVSSLGVKVGGREVPAQPMEGVRGGLAGGREAAFSEEEDGGGTGTAPGAPGPSPPQEWEGAPEPEPEWGENPRYTGPVHWSPEAVDRLPRVPRFVRGMVKRIYTDYAREKGIPTLTPEIMDVARAELGLEGM
jgi:hypothetical protein